MTNVFPADVGGGFAGREDGHGKPAVHRHVLPPGVLGPHQPHAPGGNAGAQGRSGCGRARRTELRRQPGDDPRDLPGVGASPETGKIGERERERERDELDQALHYRLS